MKLRIVKHRKARRDVLREFVYIGEQNYDAAERFLNAVNADLKRLAEMPGMGAIREFKNHRLAGIRSWPVSLSSEAISSSIAPTTIHFSFSGSSMVPEIWRGRSRNDT